MSTPLHVAVMGGHLSAVEVLIRSHADISAITVVSQCIATLQYKQFMYKLLHLYFTSVQNIMSYIEQEEHLFKFATKLTTLQTILL